MSSRYISRNDCIRVSRKDAILNWASEQISSDIIKRFTWWPLRKSRPWMVVHVIDEETNILGATCVWPVIQSDIDELHNRSKPMINILDEFTYVKLLNPYPQASIPTYHTKLPPWHIWLKAYRPWIRFPLDSHQASERCLKATLIKAATYRKSEHIPMHWLCCTHGRFDISNQ